MNKPQTLAEVLREKIELSRLTYFELAAVTGIAYHRIRRIAVYALDPTLDEAAAIEKALAQHASRLRGIATKLDDTKITISAGKG